MMLVANTFGELVELWRIAKNLKKSEIARRVEIVAQYFTDIEVGRVIPSEEKIQKLVEVLDLDEYEAFKLADKLPLYVYEEAKRKYFSRGSKATMPILASLRVVRYSAAA